MAYHARGSEKRTGDPPWTPSFIQLVPYLPSSNGIDVAWPPVTDILSIIVTLNRSGCAARVEAHD